MVLPFADRARHGDGLCLPHAGCDGFRLRHQRVRARATLGRRALGLGRVLADRGRRHYGDGTGRARPRFGALHLLSASHRQPILLYRRGPGRGRLVGLGRPVVGQSGRLEAGEPGRAGAACDVRQFAGSYLWAWTAVGAAIELLLQIIPVALGLKTTIDAGLARVFFSWTLHSIVYFWLIPSYIAFYAIVPRAIGGKVYSDTMARIAFISFLVVAMPIGIHHTFADPQVGAGFKFIHSAFTALVVVPTLLTVFTICASVEIAGRLRGGRGLFGWIKALPWDNPIMLALAFSFIMLGFGGAGGIINMSYQLDASIHNTQWITGHFHLI